MNLKNILLALISCVIFTVQAVAVTHEPLYIVNGVERPAEEVDDIPPAEIEQMDILPADEVSIAKYGDKASNGVVLVTLRYDTAACFGNGDMIFAEWVAAHVTWSDNEPAARIVIRYRITAEGRVEVDEVLETTDKRLLRRVMKALAAAPVWTPATKNGAGIECEKVLRLQLPKGKRMPHQPELIIR